MKRYEFLTKDGVYSALNKLRAAFLAAKDGNDVEEIIMGVLTADERLRIGRRLQIAEMILQGKTFFEIKDDLKVGNTTIQLVERMVNKNPRCYELVHNREEKVQKEFQHKAYKKEGGSKLVFKRKSYTGFKRKDVGR
jgi:uncharacterized protein YerC